MHLQSLLPLPENHASTNRFAVANPIPLLPPVTTAIFPASFCDMLFSSGLSFGHSLLGCSSACGSHSYLAFTTKLCDPWSCGGQIIKARRAPACLRSG